MSGMDGFSWKELDKFLLHIGCEFKRQKGSHRVYKKDGVIKLITIPEYKSVSQGVVMQMIRNLGIEKEEFLRIIKTL